MNCSGAMTALVTPFREGAVDESALAEFVEAQVAAGIHGLVPCGTTGESVNLTDAEYARVLAVVVEAAAGRVPVIAGSGSASTAHTIALSKLAQAAGVDGLLVVVPYYNRPTQAGLEAHYRAVAAAVPMPIVLYNIPGRSGVDLIPDTLGRLTDVSTIVAVKEATGDVARSAALVERFGDRYAVMSGDDALTLPIMKVGGTGVISVTSNVAPALMARLVDLMGQGDEGAAEQLNQRLAPLFDAMFVESSPGPVKVALSMLGRMDSEIRLPLVLPESSVQERIQEVLKGLELA